MKQLFEVVRFIRGWDEPPATTARQRRPAPIAAPIASEATCLAGHRTDAEHDCFLMRCYALARDLEQAREFVRHERGRLLREVDGYDSWIAKQMGYVDPDEDDTA